MRTKVAYLILSAGIRMDGEMIKYQKADSISIKMGAFEKFHQTIGVWDIMSILPEELPKLDGVLSLKTFGGDIPEREQGSLGWPQIIRMFGFSCLQGWRIQQVLVATHPDFAHLFQTV